MSVNKVQLANGETIIDISDSTVTPETLAEGVTAHNASGQKITGKMVPGGTSVQADWNQTNETAADFIKNKPFGDELVEIMPETEVVCVDADGMLTAPLDASLFSVASMVFAVTYDGVGYTCDYLPDSSVAAFVCGNMALFGGYDTGEPFLIVAIPGEEALIVMTDSNPHTVSISECAVNMLDTKYYSGCTMFYNDSNEYLYIDMGCTIKATKRDVVTAMKNGGIVINNFGKALTTPCNVNCATEAYAMILCTEWAGGNDTKTTFYYTAEYTT